MAQTFLLDERLAEHSALVTDLSLCQVRLQNNRHVPWLVLVPRRAEMREMIDLSPEDQHLLLDDINRAAHALQKLFKPDKLNIAALGNMVPQLHVHVIARFRTDPAWPQPVWGHMETQPYTDAEREEKIRLLRQAL